MMMFRSFVAALFVCGALSASAQKPACCASKAGAQVSATERTAILAERLKLTAEQVKSVEGILKRQEEQAHTAVASNGVVKTEKSEHTVRDASHEAILKVLDKEQAAKYEKFLTEEKPGDGKACGKESAGAAHGAGGCCASKKTAEAQQQAPTPKRSAAQ